MLKLVLTPLLIAAASLAQRKWGGLAGGLIAGLPLTSAPVSVFLALEHGPTFAAHAATGTLLGIIAMSAFCVAYVRAASRWAWAPAALFASGFCAVTTLAVSLLPQSLALAAAIAFPVLGALIVMIGRPLSDAPALRSPWWDIPARMSVALGVVLLITAAASYIGAKWSGLLSTVPVFGLVMGVFSHRTGGVAAAHALLRGFVVGSLGAAAFFLVVGALIESTSLVVTYCAAIAAGLSLVGVSQWWLSAAKRR
jgi:hypothetical protein